jgi:hypothetical protein
VHLDCSNGLTDSAEQISKPDKPFEEWNPPSIGEVNQFIRWVREHIDVDMDASNWDFRIGATMSVFEHYKEAIVALERAEQQSQTNWGLFFNLAMAHESEKNHCTAL